jgi:hypothetical protein
MIAWILFTLCVSALLVLVVGGICHSAGMADREIERLESESPRNQRPGQP